MGGSRFDANDWTGYSSTTRASVASAGVGSVFKSRDMHADMNPKGITFRESRDSVANPNSTPIIIGLDVTGSMGKIPANMITNSLGKMFQDIYDRQPVSDPSILFAGIGDSHTDRAPLQVGQFESGNEITQWLEKLWLEGNGGGNDSESYDLLYYFAAYHTQCDAFLKRQNKGYVFSIGDELPANIVPIKHIEKVFGYTPQADFKFADLITQVRKSWIPYHLLILEGAAKYSPDSHKAAWNAVMGQNVIPVDDYTKLPEIITSILEINNGVSVKDTAASWSGSTAVTVAKALSGLTVNPANDGKGKVIRF